jgi:hypothetical protein
MMLMKNDVKKIIATIFTDPSWKLSQAVGFPNSHARLDRDDAIYGAVVVRGGRGPDYALNEEALEYLLEAKKEGRITLAYVVLAQLAADGRLEFVAAEEADVVRERLRGVPPREGRFGRYWWITVEFMPASTMRLSSDAVF